jgi:hypothetical protein
MIILNCLNGLKFLNVVLSRRWLIAGKGGICALIGSAQPTAFNDPERSRL